MKTSKNKFIIILLISLITFTSCDIQKKRYSRGYTLDWNKKYKSIAKSDESVINHIEIDSTTNQNTTITKVKDDKTEHSTVQNELTEIVTKEITPDKFLTNKKTKSFEEQTFSNPINSNETNISGNKIKPTFKKKKSIAYAKERTQKANSMAVAALIMSLLFLLLFIPVILSFIFGIIALVQIKKDPLKYNSSSKRIAIAAITIDLFISLLLISLLSSWTVGIVVILLAIILIAMIVTSTVGKPNTLDKQPRNTEKKPKIKKERNYEKLNKFWLKNRLLALFILVFSALLLIPLGL